MKSLISSVLFLLVAFTANAETFEISGAVQRIELEKSLITIDGKRYQLPNRVPESLVPTGGPVIYQLRPGSVIAASGSHATPFPKLDSVAILRQPSPEEQIQMQSEMDNE
ncbi:type IV pilus assembly protein PilY2 [Ectopseudomonas chengduensis]|uniref:Type IV pilus assembly protein PilY2 n=1 Tax=Ectopseudomonas chengduensis TaxID=489632 RepID=A0A1G6RX13_9GAMM|nr:PilY2 family type 4a fimbrial biogenesis protein [Pseudomonas chengduensis]MBP3062391.1 hypothetical protein [Pseudomonas chengduensis]NNB75991.1 PilY2 family type 4a fimbrial biogenesis protein [Pseudomonas chengduensis]SDD08476.1 type IV pilus assembly protein PilY2 [Pseudomonas chengduensis]